MGLIKVCIVELANPKNSCLDGLAKPHYYHQQWEPYGQALERLFVSGQQAGV